MRGCICTTLGVLPEQVGLMAYADAMLLWEYWERFPPSHVLLAAKYGFPKDEEDEESEEDEDDAPPARRRRSSKPPKEISKADRAAAQVIARSNVKGFDTLPLAIQARQMARIEKAKKAQAEREAKKTNG